ncbi:MAG: AraC family transcriptional regulator [Bacteroidota bacterium]
MEIIRLPEAFNHHPDTPIQVYDYRVHEDCIRGKINLTHHTISFLLQGKKEVVGIEETVRIDPQKFVLMKSGHCLMTEHTSEEGQIYQSMLLFFSHPMILDFLEHHEIRLTPQDQIPSFFVYDYDPYIHHFVQGLGHVRMLAPAIQETILKAKFEELMWYLLQREGNAFLSGMVQDPYDSHLRLRNVVESNKHKKLNLQELAFLCNMSVSTFKRAFVKQFGLPPIRWFQEKRLEYAAFILQTHQKRPIDLYEEIGYESLSNFVQAFKKKYGITPKQFQLES